MIRIILVLAAMGLVRTVGWATVFVVYSHFVMA